MAKRTTTRGMPGPSSYETSATSLIVTMEPDLRLLKGLITMLRYLGERSSSDMIEPTAIAALSIPAEEAIDRMIALGREP